MLVERATPRVEAVVENPFSLARIARQLERELAQAQINLKRVQASLDCAQENFHVTNQAYIKADAELAQAQARCAELEKLLEECRGRVGIITLTLDPAGQ